MIKKILLFLLMAAMPLPLRAENLSKDFAACASISSDSDRLACYDTLARREAESDGKEKKWFVSSVKYRRGKTQNVFMSMDSLDPVRDASGFIHVPSLCIRCSDQHTAVYIVYGSRLGTGQHEIAEAMDDGSPSADVWKAGPDFSALYREDAINFLKKLMKHKVLKLRILPPNDKMQTVVFPVADLNKAIAPLRKACKW